MRIADDIALRAKGEMCVYCPRFIECQNEGKNCDALNGLIQVYSQAQSHLSKDKLEETYLSKNVHVVIHDPWHPIEADGVVTYVDDAGQLHGTWGSLAAILPYDWVNLIEEEKSND